MTDPKDDEAGPAVKVVPVEDVAAEIVQAFEQAHARAARPALPTPEQQVALITDAWKRHVEAIRDAVREDARLFPAEHRGLEPGPGSGTA